MPKQLQAHGILMRPLITEKAQKEASAEHVKKYTFQVDLRANKLQIKDAVEVAFNVRVNGVNTCVMKGKRKRYGRGESTMPNWKKAVVTLAPGEKIELFEGV
jgi:large subunit ribosomal protein L23